jgi:hypothetical protein
MGMLLWSVTDGHPTRPFRRPEPHASEQGFCSASEDPRRRRPLEGLEPGSEELVADQSGLDSPLADADVSSRRFEAVLPVEPVSEGVGGAGVGGRAIARASASVGSAVPVGSTTRAELWPRPRVMPT